MISPFIYLCTWKIPGILPVSSVSPQILPQSPDQLSDSGKLESCQNGAPNTSGFPGNFRKRKVLETLSFPFWFPETWVQANTHERHTDTNRLTRHTASGLPHTLLVRRNGTRPCVILAYIPHLSCEPGSRYLVHGFSVARLLRLSCAWCSER